MKALDDGENGEDLIGEEVMPDFDDDDVEVEDE